MKPRRLQKMLSNLNASELGPCSLPDFRSPSGQIGSLEPRTLSSLKHGHNAGVAALGKVVFSLASEGSVSLWVHGYYLSLAKCFIYVLASKVLFFCV